MDTKEKLEQAAIVKEKGTMYFKVCDTWGRSRELCFWVLGASPRSPHWVFKGQKTQAGTARSHEVGGLLVL